MSELLRQKSAVINGAAPIGGAVVRAFAREGTRVLFTRRVSVSLEVAEKQIVMAGRAAETGEVGPHDVRVLCLQPNAIPESAS